MQRFRSIRLVLSLSVLASLALPAMALPSPERDMRAESMRERVRVVFRAGTDWLRRLWDSEGCLIDPGGVCRADRVRPENEGDQEVGAGRRTFVGRWN